MSRLINSLLRLFLVLLLLVGMITIWEQVRGTQFMNRFRRSDTKSEHLLLTKVAALGKLELVKYTFKDIVEHEQVNTFLPNANAILVVEGEVTGCIDLGKITSADIKMHTDSVTIHLPQPELCSWKINHERSRVYDTRFFVLE